MSHCLKIGRVVRQFDQKRLPYRLAVGGHNLSLKRQGISPLETLGRRASSPHPGLLGRLRDFVTPRPRGIHQSRHKHSERGAIVVARVCLWHRDCTPTHAYANASQIFLGRVGS